MTEIEKALTHTGTEKLTEALAAAQAEMKNAPLNKINPHFKNRYADLAAIRDATIPSLSKHGLTLTQRCEFTEGGAYLLITTIAHKSGGKIESVYPLPLNVTPQALGSAMTYGRRYTWAALCGIAAEDDDDAETAEKAGAKSNKAPEMKAPTIPAEALKPIVGSMGEIPKWRGPLKVTALKAAMQTIRDDVGACTDLTQLETFLETKEVKDIIDQAKIDLPGWWFGAGDSPGLSGRIEEALEHMRSLERA